MFGKISRRRAWQPAPVFFPGESQGRRSLVGCRLWGRTESDMTDSTAAAADPRRSLGRVPSAESKGLLCPPSSPKMCQKRLRFGFELQIAWGPWPYVTSSNYNCVTTPALSLLCTPGELDPHIPTGIWSSLLPGGTTGRCVVGTEQEISDGRQRQQGSHRRPCGAKPSFSLASVSPLVPWGQQALGSPSGRAP